MISENPGDNRAVRRKLNENFVVKNNFKELNLLGMRELLEDSFGKPLSDDYFSQPVERIIISKDYSGIAVVKRIRGVPYLDKIAVIKKRQRKGLGKALLNTVKFFYSSFLWRSSVMNPANNWYLKECDSAIRKEGWVIFLHNISPDQELISNIANIPKTVKDEYCLSKSTSNNVGKNQIIE